MPDRWDPFRTVRDLESEFKRFFGGTESASTGDFPQVNIWTGQDRVIVTAELPGVAADDLDISVVGDTLTLRGERAADPGDEAQHYHRRERGHGPFARVLRLPFEVDADAAAARLSQGLLEVDLRRPASHRPHRIEVHGP